VKEIKKQPQLGELLDDIIASVGDILINHYELQLESVTVLEPTDSAKKGIERIQKRLVWAKARLAKAKEASARRKKLEKVNDLNRRGARRHPANESKVAVGRIQLLNGQGRLIGWLHSERNGKVTVYDARGRLVARELAGITLDHGGRLVGKGRQGLIALGRKVT
jgi:hypothetical protein